MNDQQKRIEDLEREVAELERELKAAQETLHDRYVMAALTGWMANPASGDCTVKACVDDAFAAADAAMKARKA